MRSTHVDRPQYKFSAAHMTVFPDGSKERLHGHNYQLSARLFLRDVAPAVMCDFAVIKEGLRRVAADLNERTLVALHNPHLIVSVEDGPDAGKRGQVRLSHRDGDYVLPLADVALLPLDNITSERLAEHCHRALAAYLRQALPEAVRAVIIELEVEIEELPGQGASYRAELEAEPEAETDTEARG
jgi:6-pyruvoyltetrahydropterin/6-carboxytetrahydropterin synthase